jgi:predicted ATPase with chaperone activity
MYLVSGFISAFFQLLIVHSGTPIIPATSLEDSQRLLEMAIDKLGLSARAYSRILKVARTIADLEENDQIRASHVAEAIQYRNLDRRMI